MDAICADASVTRGALYHNFGGKAALFEAVIRQIDDEMGDRVLAAAPEETVTLTGFIQACEAYLDLALDPEVQKLVFLEAPGVLGQRLREIDAEGFVAPLAEALASLIAQGALKRAEVEPLARMLNGAMIEGALWIAAQDDQTAALSKAKAALRALISGMAGASAT